MLSPSDKALVPFVFAFQPALLLVTDNFTWTAFSLAFSGTVLGIWALAAAVSNWLFAPLRWYERVALVLAAILLVAPDLTATVIGLLLVAPIMARQLLQKDRTAPG